jgi:hypothetical protein
VGPLRASHLREVIDLVTPDEVDSIVKEWHDRYITLRPERKPGEANKVHEEYLQDLKQSRRQ